MGEGRRGTLEQYKGTGPQSPAITEKWYFALLVNQYFAAGISTGGGGGGARFAGLFASFPAAFMMNLLLRDGWRLLAALLGLL